MDTDTLQLTYIPQLLAVNIQDKYIRYRGPICRGPSCGGPIWRVWDEGPDLPGPNLPGTQKQGRIGMCVWDNFHDFSLPFPIVKRDRSYLVSNPKPKYDICCRLDLCWQKPFHGKMVKDHFLEENNFLKVSLSLRWEKAIAGHWSLWRNFCSENFWASPLPPLSSFVSSLDVVPPALFSSFLHQKQMVTGQQRAQLERLTFWRRKH